MPRQFDGGMNSSMVRIRPSHRPTPARIDCEWPHQVALADDLCVEQNFTLIREFCAARGFGYVTHKVWAVWLPERRKQELYRLYCFKDADAAKAFQAHFGGYLFDPKRDREDGRTAGVWLREGEHKRVLTSGPLSVPEVLRN